MANAGLLIPSTFPFPLDPAVSHFSRTNLGEQIFQRHMENVILLSKVTEYMTSRASMFSLSVHFQIKSVQRQKAIYWTLSLVYSTSELIIEPHYVSHISPPIRKILHDQNVMFLQ